jgi:hypothetical protein
MSEQVLIAGGDVILGEEPEKFLAGVAPILKNADVRLAQLECPYIDKATEQMDPSRETRNLGPLKGLFDVMTLAGNHLYDFGENGVRDTLRWLDGAGILHTGGGMNLAEAEKPAIFVKEGVRYGFLNFNCVGSELMHASENKAGCAFANTTSVCMVTSIIEPYFAKGEIPIPEGSKGVMISYPRPEYYIRVGDLVAELRPSCDVLSVYFHKGAVHKPALVEPYERLISRIAIDAGADVVFSSHAHILRGVEIYKGRTIFHGLNNFAVWAPLLSPNYKGKFNKTEFSDQEEWNRKRIARFGFVPDPDYPTYPFHPESVHTAAAKCIVRDGKIAETRLIPLLVGKDGVTRVLHRDELGQKTFDYIVRITDSQNLNVRYEWKGDEMVIIER